MKDEKPSPKKAAKSSVRAPRKTVVAKAAFEPPAPAAPVAAKAKAKPVTPAPVEAPAAPVVAKAKAKPAAPAVAPEPIAAAAEPAKPKVSKPRAPRKVAAPKETLTVPPILLEGDKPSTPPPSGPAQRYALGPVPPGQHPAATPTADELPEAYGTGQLLLTARDPHWLYARWDLSREQQRKYNALSIDHHLVIRIFAGQAKGEPLANVHVHPESNHWFVPVDTAGTKYMAQLGYYDNAGKWAGISTSGATLTPPDSLSDDLTAQFATIPIEVPFEQLIDLAKAAIRDNIPLTEVLQQLRARGFQVPESHTGRWTPEQEHALASIISMDRVRRVWMGSLEITELIQRRLQQEISSMMAAQFSLPSSPVGALGSVSSPFGAAQRPKGFWFMVNAELILYGATEPDAQVTIGGRTIKLRPDGSFSYRFALPDGAYELPAVAVSSDKSDARTAELRFSRRTEYQGEVGAHPQDPQLKLPIATNVS